MQKHQQLYRGEIRNETNLSNIPSLDNTTAALIQLSHVTESGVSEFIDCPEIVERFPDAFALRVDGDSMTPRIQDGDLVILSPSAPARDGATAVAKMKNQIGVTCKIIRRSGVQVHLIAANENFENKIYNIDQLVWSLAVLWRIRLP